MTALSTIGTLKQIPLASPTEVSVSGQESRSPSVAELQKFIREKSKLEFLLSNGDKVVGTLRWFDDHCFSVVQEYEGPITLIRTSVLGYRALE